MATTIEEACEQALSSFDFVKATAVYQMLGWKWQGKVPDEARVRATAEELCKLLREQGGMKERSVRTGGLVASLVPDEDHWEVQLEFVVVAGFSDTFQGAR